MLGFFSSLPNWDFPTPSLAGECVTPLLWLGGGGGAGYTLVCGRGSGGGPISDEGTETVVF